MVAATLAALVIVGGGGYLALQAFTATSQATAAFMPPDTGIYLSVDLLQFLGEERTGDLVRTVRGVLADLGEEVDEPEDLIARLDDELLNEVGFDFSHDVRPWIGRTVGVGVLGDLSAPEGIVAVEVRDVDAADTFLSKLATTLPERIGAPVTTAVYRDVDLLVTVLEGEEIVFGRAGRMLLAGTRGGVEQSIDAASGPSLHDVPAFAQTTSLLPTDRALTAWVNGSVYRELGSRLGTAAVPGSVEGLRGGALGITITDIGAAFDVAAQFSGAPLDEELFGVRGSIPAVLPADTLAFARFPSPAALWELTRSNLGSDAQTVDDELETMVAELGFHPIDDLVAHLDGSGAVALVASDRGVLARESGFDVGVLAFAGTSEPGRVAGSLDTLTRMLRDQGAAMFSAQGFFVLDEDGSEVVAYGVRDGRLLVGSSVSILSGVGTEGARLDGTDAFVQAVKALPGDGYDVSFYADVDRLASIFGADRDLATVLEPIDSIVAATKLEAETFRGTLVIVIDY